MVYGASVPTRSLSLINTGHTSISFVIPRNALEGSGFTVDMMEKVHSLPPQERLPLIISFDPVLISLTDGKASTNLNFNVSHVHVHFLLHVHACFLHGHFSFTCACMSPLHVHACLLYMCMHVSFIICMHVSFTLCVHACLLYMCMHVSFTCASMSALHVHACFALTLIFNACIFPAGGWSPILPEVIC